MNTVRIIAEGLEMARNEREADSARFKRGWRPEGWEDLTVQGKKSKCEFYGAEYRKGM